MIRLLKRMHLRSIKILALILMIAGNPFSGFSQESEGPTIDKIIAKVDNYIILLSDIEFAYLDLSSRGALRGENPKCEILKSVITQKMMLAVAEMDSVMVLDAQVDIELSNRMQYFISQSGGNVEALEEYYGKSLDEIRSEMRDDMKEQLVANKMRQVIAEDVTITP